MLGALSLGLVLMAASAGAESPFRPSRPSAPFRITLNPGTAGARDVKVVVYDYGSDLLGTAVARIR